LADKKPAVTVVGAESLLGREVVDVLGTQKFPADVKLVSGVEPDEPASAILTEREGEPVFLTMLQAGEFIGSRAVLLAGAPWSSSKAAEVTSGLPKAPVLIDLTGVLEDSPAARLRAPMAEDSRPTPPAPIYVVAHPAAIVLAVFLKQLVKAAPMRRVVAQVFEPVSERGKKGLDELQQQTVGLLSFQKLKKEVFDTQVSFNMLPAFGSEALRSLEDVENTVDRHLATLLSSQPAIPLPSLRVVHAPVFHGYSFSLWIEFESRPSVETIAAAIAGPRVDVRSKDEEPPSNVGVAGQSGVAVGSIVPDRNDPRACWFWIAADNLRITADNALEVARELFE
jgi:aspartate-semialdehyde dehydrogenase